MPERLGDHPEYTSLILEPGISHDGITAITDCPIAVGEIKGDCVVIKAKPQTAGNYFYRREVIGGSDHYQTAEGLIIPFPFGTIYSVRKDEEIQFMTFNLGPRIYDEQTSDIINSLIQDFTHEEEVSFVRNLTQKVSCYVSEEEGVIFYSGTSEHMIAMISHEGFLAVDDNWTQVEQDLSDIYQCKYQQEVGQTPSIEVSTGKITQYLAPGIIDKDHLLVVGANFSEVDGSAIYTALADLVLQNRATEDEMREIIDPYIRLVEVNPS